MSYEPRPDSVAFRALAHMELLHKGSEITSAMLATGIGAEASGMQANLEVALRHKLIFCRRKGGHPRSPVFWSLVDHSKEIPQRGLTEVRPRDEVMEPEACESATGRGTNGAPALAIAPTRSPSVGSMGAGQAADAAADGELTLRQIIAKRGRIALTHRAHAPKPEVKKHTSTPPKLALDLRIALWSDGTLEIRRTPDDLILFTADEARAIVDYLVAVEA